MESVNESSIKLLVNNLNNGESITQIVDYFTASFHQASVAHDQEKSLQVMEQVTQYVKDTAKSVTENLVAVGDSFDALLQKQDAMMSECSHKISSIALRLKVAHVKVTRNFTNEMKDDRIIFNKRPKIRKIDVSKLPQVAKVLPEWNHSKLDFDSLEKYGGSIGSSSKLAPKLQDPNAPPLVSSKVKSPTAPPPMLSLFPILFVFYHLGATVRGYVSSSLNREPSQTVAVRGTTPSSTYSKETSQIYHATSRSIVSQHRNLNSIDFSPHSTTTPLDTGFVIFI